MMLIVILAITGGVIAYLGDRIGMKIGRKRLTLFGLRPKHTSILITILTGVFIATATRWSSLRFQRWIVDRPCST